MKKVAVLALVALSSPLNLSASTAPVNWAQPPLLCVEDVVPKVPTKPCPDLSGVVDPSKDDPNIPEAELKEWKNTKFAYGYCRATEILRRERANPGTMSAGAIQISWMRTRAVQNSEVKVNAVYDAAEANGIPPHILTGAIMQESIFSNLGISDDGGNYSCGMAQINLPEWCDWAETQSVEKKKAMGWPTQGIDCREQANRGHIEPFYKIGLKRLGDLPAYRLEPSHAQNVPFESVEREWRDVGMNERKVRYQMATSFLNNCGLIADPVRAKAHVLKRNYNAYIPKGLKEHETYAPGQKFNLRCQRPLNSTTYPLQSAWVMAVGTYNAGGRVQDMMASTHKWSRDQISQRETFANYNPDRRSTSGFNMQDLIASIYYAGKYNRMSGKMKLKALNGSNFEFKWTKLCVLQRHMARVVQHVTRGDVEFPLVKPMEGAKGCPRDGGDPDPR